MNPILKNILGVVLGIVIGSIINMGIIHFGNMLIPLPEGVDTNTAEGLKAAIPLFEFKHFLTPFFAHALGTLAGAIVAARIAATNKLKIALTIGFFFFLGGFSMIFMIPSPLWFSLTDLILAYIPMAYLGARLAGGNETSIF